MTDKLVHLAGKMCNEWPKSWQMSTFFACVMQVFCHLEATFFAVNGRFLRSSALICHD